MALTVVGTSTGEYSNQGIKTLTWPAGVASGDIAFVITSVYENALIDGYIQAQHSFTEATPSPPGWYSGSANTRNGSQVFYKECAGTESGTMDWDVTGAATIYANIALVVFSAAGNLTYASISAQGTGSSVTDAVAPSVSGTSGQHLFCVFGITDPPGTTNSAPSGMTLSVDGVNTGANSVRAYHETLASTGATGTRTWDFSNTRDYGTFSVLINESASGSEYSAGGSTGIQNYIGFQASQIGLYRNVTPGIAEFNAVGFAPSTSAGRQIDAAVGYANAVGFGAQSIQDAIGIAGRINFNTGTHQTHVTREFFGLLGQLRALGFLVDQTNSTGFFPNLGAVYFQGPTGATVTVVSPPTTFTASALLRETHFVGLQAQTIRDFFPISASTHALGFTPQYVEFIKEITGPDIGEVNFSGFQAQAIVLGQINDAIGQKGEVNLVGFQHAVDMWRTLDILQGRINMHGFAAGVALFQGGTINLSGVTGEINFDTLQQAIGMYRTFYPDSGLTNAEGYVPVPSTGTLVQSIVGALNQEGFIPFIVAERYRGIVGEMRLEGFAPTIGGGLWTPKRRRATSWAAIN